VFAMRILITGGAGFVGTSLALAFRDQARGGEVVAFDSLRRRGAEMNVPILKNAGVSFIHGDVRAPADLEDVPGNFDFVIEASAEPSVLAGIHGSPRYVLETNLVGMLHCLEFARRRAAAVLFLSTSRVYSIEPLRTLRLTEASTRFDLATDQSWPGVGAAGISEDFPVHQPRSFYGASKLAAEYILQEYVQTYGLKAVINRCGVIAGPGQFGKVDQGVFTLWVAHHYFGRPLRYTGFGGTGKQVRDLLDPRDLFALIQRQVGQLDQWQGESYNVGGGPQGSVSLQEFTGLCQAITGRTVPVGSDPLTGVVDIPWYVSDIEKVRGRFGWEPRTKPEEIVIRITEWIRGGEATLRSLFS
jgi:CDP-paratose 2-epimerase